MGVVKNECRKWVWFGKTKKIFPPIKNPMTIIKLFLAKF